MGTHRHSRFGLLKRKPVDKNKLRESKWTTGPTRINGGAIGVNGNPAMLTQPGIHGRGPGREECGKACEAPGEREEPRQKGHKIMPSSLEMATGRGSSEFIERELLAEKWLTHSVRSVLGTEREKMCSPRGAWALLQTAGSTTMPQYLSLATLLNTHV